MCAGAPVQVQDATKPAESATEANTLILLPMAAIYRLKWFELV